MSFTFRGLLAPQSALARLNPFYSTTTTATNILRSSTASPIRWISTTSAFLKGAGDKKGGAAKGKPKTKPAKQMSANRRNKGVVRSENYARVKILKKNMFSPAPPPLRMGRLRWLRHWTIHRAWLLFQRNQKEMMQKERARMHAGMYNACEELRQVSGPGVRSEGYLYRVAMEKKGVWGLEGVPIEYARFQTDNPANEPWNHAWTK